MRPLTLPPAAPAPPRLLLGCRAPTLSGSPTTTFDSASVLVLPHSSMQPGDYSGAQVTACPLPTGTCVPATCADLSARCQVRGLTAGTQYNLTAVMDKDGGAASVASEVQTATPLHE